MLRLNLAKSAILALELAEDRVKKYSFSAFYVLFLRTFLHFAQRVSDLVETPFRDSKPPLGHRCFVFSKGNLAVRKSLVETVQVFGRFFVFFQRKRRRDVCKNAYVHFY